MKNKQIFPGCNVAIDDYEIACQTKVKQVTDLIGDLDEIYFMDKPLYYRHKVIASFTVENKKILAGMIDAKNKKILDIDNSLVEHPLAIKIIQAIKKLVVSFKWKVDYRGYVQDCLRHVLIRISSHSQKALVVLVTNSDRLKGLRQFSKALIDLVPEIDSLYLCLNKRDSVIVLTDNIKHLAKNYYLSENILNINYDIGPLSFFQINPEMMKILYQRAINCLNLKGNETVLDCYCGLGSISLFMANKVKRIIGVENNLASVKSAIHNAKMNKINNAEFIYQDASLFMLKSRQKFDVIIVDPPRSGLTDKFINGLVKNQPNQFLYISCNPVTCARDLKKLSKNYKIDRRILVDQFPLTEHVETVVLLSKL